MPPTRLRCMLVMPDGPSRRVGANGIVIGRGHDCDLVALDPSLSRRHALVRMTSEGAEVVPIGRAPVGVNGKSSDKPQPLADGDELRLPGLVLRVSIEAAAVDPEVAAGFVLQRERGGSFGIAHTPFVVGGDQTDDLIVKKWPGQALCFHLAQGELFVEVRRGKATCNDVPLAVGELEAVAAGDRLAYRGETFTVGESAGRAATTAVDRRSDLPVRVEIELLPRGGRVVFTIAAGDRAVYLADRRLDLMMALLRPPEGYTAGEFVPDDTVRAIVWPRNIAVTRPEINMLISRCRRDLVQAGLAGPRLLERSPGGGGTRIRLAANAEVVVRS